MTLREGRTLGRVSHLYRYPVKSMAAEPLQSVELGWHGFRGDRRWGVIRPGKDGTGFPWLTLRDRPDLWRYRPELTDPSDPDGSPVVVRTPAGERRDVTDPALADELRPSSRVVKQGCGVFDSAPISLVTTASVEGLGTVVGRTLDLRRFRPNLVVDAGPEPGLAEEGWVGAVLRLGEARIRVDRRDRRCAVVTIDPETGEKEPAILRSIAQEREGCFGVYGSTVSPGRITVGDPVTVAGRTE